MSSLRELIEWQDRLKVSFYTNIKLLPSGCDTAAKAWHARQTTIHPLSQPPTNGIWAWAYKTNTFAWDWIDHSSKLAQLLWLHSTLHVEDAWMRRPLVKVRKSWRPVCARQNALPKLHCHVLNLGHLHRGCNRSALASWSWMTMSDTDEK